jgi:4-hydroxybenzoate polyprenyltransferase
VIVGLITSFAGYTAVYALNDIVDYRADKVRLSLREDKERFSHLDEIMVRHPVAQGAMPLSAAVTWFLFWIAVAVMGAWWLNPFCVVLLACAAGMEALYCKLLKISHLKVVPSAVVKAIGGLAGVYAVDPAPSLGFVAVIFLWLAAWEVGGQNIANDIVDMEEDKLVSARTTATVMGIPDSTFILVAAVAMAVFGGTTIYWLSGSGVGWLYPIGAIVLGWMLLLEPARKVYHNPGPQAAAELFNKASYMPVSFLVLTVVAIYLPLIVFGAS